MKSVFVKFISGNSWSIMNEEHYLLTLSSLKKYFENNTEPLEVNGEYSRTVIEDIDGLSEFIREKLVITPLTQEQEEFLRSLKIGDTCVGLDWFTVFIEMLGDYEELDIIYESEYEKLNKNSIKTEESISYRDMELL